MKRLTIIVTIALLAATAFSQLTNRSGTYRVTGTVTDKQGAVISGVALYVKKGEEDIGTFVSDINGDFEMNLPIGDYEITVNEREDKNFRAFIKVQAGPLNPRGVVFVLDPAEACCKSADGIAYPKLLSFPRPSYPPAARLVHAWGPVLIAVKITPDGEVFDATVLSGHPLLTAAGRAAARQAQFEPSSDNNVRRAILTYIFVSGTDQPKDGIKKYSDPYRTEVHSIVVTLDTSVSGR